MKIPLTSFEEDFVSDLQVTFGLWKILGWQDKFLTSLSCSVGTFKRWEKKHTGQCAKLKAGCQRIMKMGFTRRQRHNFVSSHPAFTSTHLSAPAGWVTTVDAHVDVALQEPRLAGRAVDLIKGSDGSGASARHACHQPAPPHRVPEHTRCSSLFGQPWVLRLSYSVSISNVQSRPKL